MTFKGSQPSVWREQRCWKCLLGAAMLQLPVPPPCRHTGICGENQVACLAHPQRRSSWQHLGLYLSVTDRFIAKNCRKMLPKFNELYLLCFNWLIIIMDRFRTRQKGTWSFTRLGLNFIFIFTAWFLSCTINGCKVINSDNIKKQRKNRKLSLLHYCLRYKKVLKIRNKDKYIRKCKVKGKNKT